MNQDIVTIQSLANDKNIVVEYIDDELVIMDNVKELVEPNPTRVSMNFIVACTAGRVRAQMNGSTIELSRNQILLAPSNTMLSDFLISPDFEFKAVFLTTRLFQSFLREKINVWNEVMYIHHAHVIQIEEDGVEFFKHFYDMLRLCIDTKNASNPYHSEVIRSLMRSAFLSLCGVLKMKFPEAAPSSTIRSADNIFRAFLDLLGASDKPHRKVSSFAAELNITSKYLSYVCKTQSGKTANEWITEKIVNEITFYLKHTDLSIKQVADCLGFANLHSSANTSSSTSARRRSRFGNNDFAGAHHIVCNFTPNDKPNKSLNGMPWSMILERI